MCLKDDRINELEYELDELALENCDLDDYKETVKDALPLAAQAEHDLWLITNESAKTEIGMAVSKLEGLIVDKAELMEVMVTLENITHELGG